MDCKRVPIACGRKLQMGAGCSCTQVADVRKLQQIATNRSKSDRAQINAIFVLFCEQKYAKMSLASRSCRAGAEAPASKIAMRK